MTIRQNFDQTEYKRLLKSYHKLSDRHVLVLESDLSYQDKSKIFHYADLERKVGNELVSIWNNYTKRLVFFLSLVLYRFQSNDD